MECARPNRVHVMHGGCSTRIEICCPRSIEIFLPACARWVLINGRSGENNAHEFCWPHDPLNHYWNWLSANRRSGGNNSHDRATDRLEIPRSICAIKKPRRKCFFLLARILKHISQSQYLHQGKIRIRWLMDLTVSKVQTVRPDHTPTIFSFSPAPPHTTAGTTYVCVPPPILAASDATCCPCMAAMEEHQPALLQVDDN